jgi:hypothetical protein
MGNKIRIVKRYKDWSPFAGMEEADTVEIEDGAEGAARFITAVNASDQLDYQIIDYEVALVTTMNRPELITNPTGGGVGKLLLPGKDY